MNIQAEKLKLIEWIARLNDSKAIEKLKQFREGYSKSSDWWDEISITEKESIERGLKDIEKGKVHSHDSAKKIYGKYL
jgi:hypothetical protein